MNLKDILAIGGYPGLFKFISQSRNGIIVESILDKKRMPAYAHAKVSALEDIAIFSETGEVKLSEIFGRIYKKESGGKAPDINISQNEMIRYFESVFPDYDRKKVYQSDIRKVYIWYNILHDHNLLNLPDEIEDNPVLNTGSETSQNDEKSEGSKTKPAKKPANKTNKK